MRERAAAFVALGLCLVGLAALRAVEPERGSSWTYVVPDAGQAMDHPPLVALPLSADRPEQVIKQLDAKAGQQRLYGLLRYGSADSQQVPLMVDAAELGEFQLYADTRRGGELGEDRLVPGEGAYRRLRLKAEITFAGGNPKLIERQVIFRRGLLGKSISVATLGYLEGQVALGDRTIAARRVDADANGLFSDLRDRLWLDLNADGQWNAFSEQFPVQPILTLGGQRYAVRTDAAGTRLALDEISGVGTIQIELARLAKDATLQSLEVALMGDDGSAIAVRAEGAAVEVPEGRYAVRAVKLSALWTADSRPWNFQFTRYELPTDSQWQHVKAGQQLKLDAVGSLRLVLEGEDLAKPTAAGRQITVYPRVYTADGLWITHSDFNDKPVELWQSQNVNGAETMLCQTDGTLVGQHTSGFA